ncbi:MAG TPA: RNA polymerase sigma-70 factor [Gemmatimonadaceae bacterium]|jgi:RNA polymerase sigma-70 factor (ECF subfamily)|nr:RNA polymerase sigma-70 factor [Gemmatimonadaceae bacterium]
MSTIPAATSPAVAACAPYDDGEWVARVHEGDRAAFEALVRHYSDRLCAFTYGTTHDVEATKELVQDLFLWVWRHRHEWDVRGSLTTYLYRSARNHALSYLRHARLERRWQEGMASSGDREFERADPPRADEATDTAELSAAISRAIEALPERCRVVFRLNREHHLTYREIGETLGISVKTVEVHMGRALAALRSQLVAWRS